MELDANNKEIEDWHIVDVKNIIVKDGDTLSFSYEGKSDTAQVKFNNGVMGVNCLDNIPFSCGLTDLHLKVGNFEIVTTL